MWLVLLLLIASVGAQPLANYRSSLVLHALKLSNAYQLFKPYLNDIAYYSERVECWGVNKTDLIEVIEAYFERACELVKVNQVEASAYYLSVALSLLIDLIPHDFSLANATLYLTGIGEGEITIMEGSIREVLEWASMQRPSSVREFCLVYLTVALSLINRMPLSSFERLILTPVLRELFIASIIFTSALFSILLRKKAKFEGVDVEYEKLP